ncbi:ribosome silencing factor [Ottowia caeni]|uniref:ribosome silencing factor n=1 Tax=Ottowia caeni TaxID=2870339 RepID=UPI001E29F0F0|nr:ribosome silencing factor [Ottowia caeni]
MSETAQKKDIQKLQRAIVDGLEDVKAHNIEVFNTEHLSPLFERVMVATGNSNRQTKAIAASVRDKVREAGFPKPRIEGEENGEWIIVDCGAAVAHIMQPTIRQYYNLEEIWGDKPVRLKGPAASGKAVAKKAAAAKTEEKPVPAKKAVAKKATAKAPVAKTPAAKSAAVKSTAAPAKKAVKATPATVAKKLASKKVTVVTSGSAVKKAPAKKVAVKVVGKPAPAKKAPAKKAPAKKATKA